ncbi:WD40-repeat-containing domain protein [Kockovaella imperatae]|uniref:WD40-repeat-containing domain protein n=1 Tax=Kockovaella imperatae TaxID=4999 RepID=A0A1Y1U6Q6_9TREE|nr:WD40-repeat-containing domain protein [Kockovaella imperatae]ORX33682.1 WD40-repeat-containing domain protein [Kockovaella imperatae]
MPHAVVPRRSGLAGTRLAINPRKSFADQLSEHPTTLPAWAEQLTDTPPRSEHLVEEARQVPVNGVFNHEDWELRTETEAEDDRHSKQVHHYRTLLIRAHSSSSAELHEVHSRLHTLQRHYDELKALHDQCDNSRSAVKNLSREQRVQLLGEIVASCHPSDVDAQIALLQKYKKSTGDILGRLGDNVSARILSYLDLSDIMHIRLVSKRYHAITQVPALWQRMCRQIGHTGADVCESHFRRLWERELRWRRGNPVEVTLLEGHTSYVTSIMIRGETIISGSYDGTIRIWNFLESLPPTILPGKPISCLDYHEAEGVLVTGSHDVGRIQIWRNGEIWRTLSGHLHGIRAVAINHRWLVSAGADKALVVWDWRTGEKVTKFGQQTNICAGIHLLEDYIMAMTVDGIIRTFGIVEREMLGQHRLTDIAPGVSENVNWFEGHGRYMTCATRHLIIELEWEDASSGSEMPPRRQALTSRRPPDTPVRASTAKSTLSPVLTSPSTFSSPRMPVKRAIGPSLPVVMRAPRLVRTIVATDIERGAVNGEKIVTSTRFAARAGADRQFYICPGPGESLNPMRGAWAEVADHLQLQTPAKNPTSIAMDRDRIAYGCTDGSVVVVSFV